MNFFFISFCFSSGVSLRNSLTTALKASDAFWRICALPALSPAPSSFLGSKALLKFPSLMLCMVLGVGVDEIT